MFQLTRLFVCLCIETGTSEHLSKVVKDHVFLPAGENLAYAKNEKCFKLIATTENIYTKHI